MSLPLPPRGVFIPAALVYSADIPAPAFQTYVQLRGLAGRSHETPPFTIQELSKLTGKSPSALYGHLAQLKSRRLLRWRTLGKGKLTVIFEDIEDEHAAAEYPRRTPADLSAAADDLAHDRGAYCDHTGDPGDSSDDSNFQESGVKEEEGEDSFQESGMMQGDSRFLESRVPSSSFNPHNLIKDSGIQEEEEGEVSFQDSGIPETGTPGRTSDPRLLNRAELDPSDDPVSIYQRLMGRRPTPPQRQVIYEQVADIDLWRKSLAHWQMHAWNPRNLPSILDFYRRGGPSTCRACSPRNPAHGGSGPAQPTDPFDELIDEYNRKANHGRSS